MFYLTMHSTYFIICYIALDKGPLSRRHAAITTLAIFLLAARDIFTIQQTR